MIIINSKHAKLLDYWGKYAKAVVCDDYFKCIEPGRTVVLTDEVPILKPTDVVFVDINNPCLNLGSGPTSIGNCLNLDARPLPNVDFVVDLEVGKLPFPDGFFKEVYAIDVIEHVSYRRVKQLLTEIARVTACGGILHVRVPDMELIAKYLLDGKFPGEHGDWFETMSWYIYGGQDYGENAHKSAFTKPTLIYLLERAGFDDILRAFNEAGHPNIVVDARRWYNCRYKEVVLSLN